MSFMKIYDNPVTRKHFNIIRSGIEERLMTMTQHFDFHPDYFNFRKDSTMLNNALEQPLIKVIEGIEDELGIGVKLCATSLYRPSFTIINGNVDYNDLTVAGQYAHYTGYSMDLSFGMMLSKYKMPKDVVIKHLKKNGFEQPFDNEDWHWSYTK